MKKNKYHLLTIVLSLALSFNTIIVKGMSTKVDDVNYTIKNESVTTDDGLKLATDVYLPIEEGKFACVLLRTPYGKDAFVGAFPDSVKWFIKNNLVMVTQDCRGKLLSQGRFYPFRNERRDGLATLKWIREQPWSNGKVAGWGSSYCGCTQWAISDKLDVLAVPYTGAEPYDLIYPGGLFSLATAFNWGFIVDANTANVIPPEKHAASYSILPLSQADDLTYRDNKFMNDWLSHQHNDQYWQQQSCRGSVNTPTLSIAGWYDIFLFSQIADFQALADSHPDNKLVIDPFCHGPQGFKNEFGGNEKIGDRENLLQKFVFEHLKGEKIDLEVGAYKDKKYSLFIIERNEYYGADEWPPKNTTLTNYYVGPNKYLSPVIPQEKGNLEYTYDPEDPYPSRGGTSLAEGVGQALQNENLSRSDQVVFETDILKSPLILLGPISATLYVSSDAPGTDFIVCLQDVFPNGNIINIQEGGATVNFEQEDSIKKSCFSVWATGYQLNPEHKLRVVITSSWFPRFNRNINSGKPIFSAETIRTANQKIYFGQDHPSAITLPVLKLEDDQCK